MITQIIFSILIPAVLVGGQVVDVGGCVRNVQLVELHVGGRGVVTHLDIRVKVDICVIILYRINNIGNFWTCRSLK